MRNLAKFEIEIRAQDFIIRLLDDAGESTEFAASPEQLEGVIEALDDLLSFDEDDDEPDDEDEPSYQKPLG